MTQSIGSFARNLIATRSDLTNSQIAELVREQFKEQGAKTTMNCIAWYKSNMKKTGYQVEKVVIDRTPEVIQAEIDDLFYKLETLKHELKMKLNETREQEEAMLEALLAKLGKKAVDA